MKTLQWALLLVISVVLLMIIAIFSAPTFINWRENKGLIENIISEYTGYQTKIQGDLQIQILPNPKLYAENITFESAYGDQDIATVGRLIIDKNLSEFLALDFSIDSMIVSRPEISLVVNETGDSNWEPLKVKNSNYYGPKLKSLIEKTLKFKKVKIENGSVLYTNLQNDRNEVISNIYTDLVVHENTRIKTESKASYDTKDYSLDLNFDVRSAGSGKIMAKLASKDDMFSMQGMLNSMYNFRAINFVGKILTEVKDANSLKINPVFDKLREKFIVLNNLKLEADVNSTPNKIEANIRSLTAENQSLSGTVGFEKKSSNRTELNLNLEILKLKLEEQAQEAKNSELKWSDEQLDFTFLNNISYNASIDCQECVYGDKVFRQVKLSSSLENNNLTLRQLSVQSENGGFLKLSATAGLNSPIALEVKSEASQFPLPTLIPSVFKGFADFKVNGNASIIATGTTPKALFSNMSGSFKFDTLDTRLNNVNPTSLKTLTESIFSNKQTARTSAYLGDVNFEGILRDGVFRVSDIYFNLNGNTIISKGKFDLANLTMSYRLQPQKLSRTNLGVIMSGNINNLEIIEDKITPKGVIDGFGRLVTTEIVKKDKSKEVKTPFDFNDKKNLDKNVKKYLFEEK